MTASELDSVLSELSGLRSFTEPIVSLYLDTRWADEQQRERVRLFVQERARAGLARYDDSPARDAVSRTLRGIVDTVRALLERTGEGGGTQAIALFACESLRLWRELQLQRPCRNELALDSMPHLVQLARLRDDVQPALVAVVDWRGVGLYEVALGAVASEATIAAPLRGHAEGGFHAGLMGGHKGGVRPGIGLRYDRQFRNLRHLDELSARYHRAASAELVRVFDETPGCRVVLAGTSENTAAFERDLPERVRHAVIARLPRPSEHGTGRAVPRDGIVEMAIGAVDAAERRSEEEAVDWAVGQALRGGLAVVGPQDVAEAVNERRVHELVIEEDFQRSGWRCQQCDAVGVERLPERCPYCDGNLAFVQALGEELVDRVLAGDGAVEIVRHSSKLHSYDGVAAMLRQTSARGLRGAPVGSQPPG